MVCTREASGPSPSEIMSLDQHGPIRMLGMEFGSRPSHGYARRSTALAPSPGSEHSPRSVSKPDVSTIYLPGRFLQIAQGAGTKSLPRARCVPPKPVPSGKPYPVTPRKGAKAISMSELTNHPSNNASKAPRKLFLRGIWGERPLHMGKLGTALVVTLTPRRHMIEIVYLYHKRDLQ